MTEDISLIEHFRRHVDDLATVATNSHNGMESTFRLVSDVKPTRQVKTLTKECAGSSHGAERVSGSVDEADIRIILGLHLHGVHDVQNRGRS